MTDAANVRSARADDAEAIARVHVDAWRETYAGLVPQRFYDEQAFEARRRMWTRYFERSEPLGRLAVAEHDGSVVGFAFAAPARGADAEKGHAPARELHLFSIYLWAERHGTGLGRGLLNAVLADEPAQLWVAAANARAIAFYERNGFIADGVQVADPDIEGLVELRMVR